MSHAKFQRTRSLTTKITEDEYSRFESVANSHGLSLSEWLRSLLQAATAEGNDHTVILGEIQSLRVIVINLLYSIASGGKVTAAEMEQLIRNANAVRVVQAAATRERKGFAVTEERNIDEPMG